MKTFLALGCMALVLTMGGVANAQNNNRANQGPPVIVPAADTIPPAQRALASQVVRLTTVDMEKQILDYMGTVFSEMQSEEVDRNVAVWFEKNAGPIMLPHIRTFMADVELLYARLLTAEELQAMIAFYDTPMGRSIARKQTQLGIDMSGPIETMTANYAEDLITRFCNANDCSDMGEEQPVPTSKSSRR